MNVGEGVPQAHGCFNLPQSNNNFYQVTLLINNFLDFDKGAGGNFYRKTVHVDLICTCTKLCEFLIRPF